MKVSFEIEVNNPTRAQWEALLHAAIAIDMSNAAANSDVSQVHPVIVAQTAPVATGTEETTAREVLPPGQQPAAGTKKKGRPSAADIAARAAAEAAPTAPAATAAAPPPAGPPPAAGMSMPPPAGAAFPPGMNGSTQHAVPEQPAMPQAPPAGANGLNGSSTVEDLRACYAQVMLKNKMLAFNTLRMDKWADGTANGIWYTVEAVPADCIDRMIQELVTAASSSP